MDTVELLESKTNDAQKWAEAFIECKNRNTWTLEDIDARLMVGWFANAMAAQEYVDKNRVMEIVDACFHAYASSHRREAKEMAQKMLGI